MSMTNVVSLDDYRGQRRTRFRQTLALCGPDGDRAELVRRLWEAVELVRADRGAILWIDEYGSGAVHVHCLLDLTSDRPRRAFASGPLRRAWEEGIPGLLDEPDLTRSDDRILPRGPRSLCAVALGSDGVRSWFLAVDSRSSRDALSDEAAEYLMFLAGECASVVLHQDLGEENPSAEGTPSFEDVRGGRFSGWPVLQDVESRVAGSGREGTITVRFLLTRLIRALVEDDLALDAEALRHQLRSVRAEIADTDQVGRERRSWERVLDAVESEDHGELAAAVLELAQVVEDRGHLHGARELDRIAYDIAAAERDLAAAIDAARFLGRVCRRLGAWEDSRRWYEIGRDVARSGELRRKEALALDGLGNTYRVRGDHPAAREIYETVLDLGEDLRDAELRGRAHQNLMLVEKHARRTDEALRHGWAAVRTIPNERFAVVALADLADVFLRSGQLDSAESAFRVVASRTEIADVRILALDALSHLAARRGDLAEFQSRLDRLSEENLEDASVEARAQILLYRGKSFLALGEPDVARRWFERSLRFAEEHGVSRIVIEAEEACQALDERKQDRLLETELPEPTPKTMSELRKPLADLREARAGAAI